MQRCRALVHVIDGTSPDPIGDYNAIQLELELFSPELKDKLQVRGSGLKRFCRVHHSGLSGSPNQQSRMSLIYHEFISLDRFSGALLLVVACFCALLCLHFASQAYARVLPCHVSPLHPLLLACLQAAHTLHACFDQDCHCVLPHRF